MSQGSLFLDEPCMYFFLNEIIRSTQLITAERNTP